VEGLFATTLDVPGALRIEMVAPKPALLSRRRAFYAWKGLSPAEIDAVLRERESEDLELASLATAPRLTYLIDADGRLEPKP
jgi:hypothetical protein